MSDIQLVNGSKLLLPFKPFTVEEVCAITGVTPRTLDYWIAGYQGSGGILERKTGDDGFSTGLDYMQTFAVFVGCYYIQEGASMIRVNGVVRYISRISLDFLEREFKVGRTFPVTQEMGHSHDLMVMAPRNRLGKLLRLDRLFEEFEARIRKVFPNG